MKTVLHKAGTRGHFDYGWLKTNHSFSFARYYNPERMSFGALRVLNDDVILGGGGFGRHPHDNMEIITIPLEGSVLHRDSMGHEQVIHKNEVQTMSAGTGIFHEEWNNSENDPASLLQIWILPDTHNLKPTYKQKLFSEEGARENWQTLADHSNNDHALYINQNASISRTFLKKEKTISYKPQNQSRGIYLFIIEGKVKIDSETLNARDAIGITGANELHIESLLNSYILNIEVPI